MIPKLEELVIEEERDKPISQALFQRTKISSNCPEKKNPPRSRTNNSPELRALHVPFPNPEGFRVDFQRRGGCALSFGADETAGTFAVPGTAGALRDDVRVGREEGSYHTFTMAFPVAVSGHR